MVYVALGDAIVRLGRESLNDPTPVLTLLRTSNRMLIDGALLAVAMLRLTLDPEAVTTIVTFLSSFEPSDPIRFWGTLAAAGWIGQEVERFLAEGAGSTRDDIRRAAIAAQRRRYLHVRPL
jgi:hypothetical protein